ncbi:MULTISPECIES: hypothetical protein [unclassified Flavobacterium]|jgi:hypothetical protein|uniref:hypothetical protein n=1 Tax=unclassified Flavobacterium TaxID=196869 RepID=UPI0025C56750|nr:MULTISPECIES: hypothetical protein [unclassified Flavobacterium]
MNKFNKNVIYVSLVLFIFFNIKVSAQLAVNTTYSGIKIAENVKLRQLSNGGKTIHRFFDTSPLSPSGRYVALFRFPYENVSPKAGDAGQVVLIDLKMGKEKVVAESRGWEMQLGANVQWGKSDKELLYNDVDTLSWKAYCTVLNPFSAKKRRLGSTVFMASNDGKKIASYDLIKSTYAQVGYGVIIPKKLIKRNIGFDQIDGIEVTDIASGKTKQLVTLKDIYEKTLPSIQFENSKDYEFYCFQVKWNPQGTRLLTTLQWSKKGEPRKRTVITMRSDGSDIRTAIKPEQWEKGGHHVNWTPDGEHLSMNLNVDGKEGLELIEVKYDGTGLKTVFSPGSGHPSYHPKGLPLIITDAYPNESITAKNGIVPIRLLNMATGKEENIVEIFVSKTDGEFRVDPHPAWDKSGRYIIFNGYIDNTRNVFMVDISDWLVKQGFSLK